MLKIHLSQSINHLSTGEKKYELKIKTSKAFIDYSQTIDDVSDNLEDCNTLKKRSVDSEANKILSTIVTESFYRGRKLNVSLAAIYTILFESA